MRPLTNFTLHAVLAAALVVFAATAVAQDKSSAWIRMQQLATGGSMAKGETFHHGWIQIESFSWVGGTPAVSSPFKGEIVGIEPSYEQSAAAKARRPVGTSDLTMKRGTSPAPSRPTPPPPEPDRFLDYDEGATGTHEAPAASRPVTEYAYDFGDTGTHEVTGANRAARDKFGRVKVKFAWDGCARGLRLPSLELRDARILYVLEGVTVTDCSAGSATFAYTGLRRSSASSLRR